MCPCRGGLRHDQSVPAGDLVYRSRQRRRSILRHPSRRARREKSVCNERRGSHTMAVIEATHTVVFPSGEHIPTLGQGTWHMAENPLNRTNEINALRLGVDLGMTLID